MRQIDADELLRDLVELERVLGAENADLSEHQRLAIMATFGMVNALVRRSKTVDAVQWIPVSERLPENEKWVVVSFHRPHEIDPEDGYEYHERQWTGVGIYSENYGFFQAMDDIGETGDEVIAWMPLPEPYKAERKEE